MGYNNQPDPLLMVGYLAIEILKPVALILIVGAVLWIVARFLVDISTWDGGHGRREQRQRHRLQNLILGTALACGVTGVVMWNNGHIENPMDFELPGGFKVHGGGMAALYTSGMFFIIWALMKMLSDTKEPGYQGGDRDRSKTTDNLPPQHYINFAPVRSMLSNVTYAKAGIVTVALLTFVGPIALLPGGFLAFKAYKKRNPSIKISLPPRE